MKVYKSFAIIAALAIVSCSESDAGTISVDDPLYDAYKKMAEITFGNTKGDAKCGYTPLEEDASRVIASCKLDVDDEVCTWIDGGTKCFSGPAEGHVMRYLAEGSGMQMFWRFEATDRTDIFEFDEFSIGVILN